ncbi:hypothetical protein HZS_4910, partial [Henneguya salminicola]
MNLKTCPMIKNLMVIFVFSIFIYQLNLEMVLTDEIVMNDPNNTHSIVNSSTQNSGMLNSTEKIENISTDLMKDEASKENGSVKILSFSEWKGMRTDNSDDDDNDTSDLDSNSILSPTVNTNLTTPHSQSHQNFASKECGARLITSNPESSHAADILNNDLDAYALNPCFSSDQNCDQIRTRIYFVIQLCEKISIRSFSVANVEIYSSNPKIIRFLYSTSSDSQDYDGEWHDAGTFTPNDSKELQKFTLSKPTHFTRIIKIEIPEYYDSDPYCPLTILQVYGTSFIDKLTYNQPISKRVSISNETPSPQLSNNTNPKIYYRNQQNSRGIISSIITYLINSSKKITLYKMITGQISNENSSKNVSTTQNNTQEKKPSETNILKAFAEIPDNYNHDILVVEDIRINFCTWKDFNEYKEICINSTKICLSSEIYNLDKNFYSHICPFFIQRISPLPLTEKIIDNIIEEDTPVPDNEETTNYKQDFSLDFDTSLPNIIKTKIRELKRNLSLTTKYLEEVSVKFREAIDDLRKNTLEKVDHLEKNQKSILI